MIDKAEYFEKLYLEQYGVMLSYAKVCLSNVHLAEDAVQETFLCAYTKLDALTASPNPQGWLMNTLKNIIAHIYREQARAGKCMSRLREARSSGSEQEPDVFLALRGLVSDEDLRLLVELYVDGKPYSYIAGRMGISEPACRKRAQKARERLQKALKKNY